jgi:hypothetical protein
MFRTVPLSIIRSFSLYIQLWYMSYRFVDSFRKGSGWNTLNLLESCLQTCMTYTTAVCTVKNSWCWTEELSETCRVSFQKYKKKIEKISASGWFHYKDTWRCRELLPTLGELWYRYYGQVCSALHLLFSPVTLIQLNSVSLLHLSRKFHALSIAITVIFLMFISHIKTRAPWMCLLLRTLLQHCCL